jgi:hypothetical protein
MKLFEFFGKAISGTNKDSGARENDTKISNDIFWFIVDHDKLHKDYLIPLARKIKSDHDTGSLDRHEIVEKFMPMTKKGCMEFYHKNKMQGKVSKLFSKEMRDDICEKLYDHFAEHIIKDQYKLGQ